MFIVPIQHAIEHLHEKFSASELINIKLWADGENEDSKNLTIDRKVYKLVFNKDNGSANILKINQADGLTTSNLIITEYEIIIHNLDQGSLVKEETIKIRYNNTSYSMYSKVAFNNCFLEQKDEDIFVSHRGKRFGSFILNFKSKNKPCIKGVYINSQYHGLIKTYYPNEFRLGNLKKEETYMYGTLHGPTVIYSTAGTILTKCNYSFGNLYGKVEEYTQSGALVDEYYCLFDRKVTREDFVEFDKKYKDTYTTINKIIEGKYAF